MGGAGTPGGTVTLLFTDVTGSTELAERLGDLQYDELLRGHKAALHAAVAANGGRVVKDLGDGLMVVFGSARAAALAAASMQAAVVGGELGLRVGVHTGEAMETGGDLHGRAVNTAARICAAAGDGEVLLSALTHALVDTAGDLSFDPPRGEWLKGIEGETQVHPLRWVDHARAGAVVGDDHVAGGEALELAPIPPPPLLDGGAFTFVGRDDVLDDLLTAWKKATTGSRGLVLLAGEPGVGKTRLAAEIARRVLDSDGHVLAGRCDEELGVAYLPFVEALRHCCDHVPAASLASVLGRLPGELRRLWPELGELVPSLAEALDADTETQRYRLFDAVASWLSALSSTRPVLLVLDDLHWATPPTIQLLRHLLRAPDAMHVLIVATYRDVELGRTHPLAEALSDLRRMPNVTRMAVDGLSAHEVERFVEAAAGHDLDARAMELARAVHQRTGGNALFISETLRHLVESGRVYLADDRWHYDADPDHLGVPEGLREVVGRRLSRLGDDANEILRMASVVGLEFDERVVAAASGRSEDEVAAALGSALGAGILAEVAPLRYRFSHAVLRDTLYDELRSSPRIRAHLSVAQAIEGVHAARLDPHLPDLAHHYSIAAPAGHSAAAIDRAVASAQQAEAGGAHEQAARFYDLGLDALEWEPDAGTEADLLIAKGTVLWRANAVDAARACFERGGGGGAAPARPGSVRSGRAGRGRWGHPSLVARVGPHPPMADRPARGGHRGPAGGRQPAARASPRDARPGARVHAGRGRAGGESWATRRSGSPAGSATRPRSHASGAPSSWASAT